MFLNNTKPYKNQLVAKTNITWEIFWLVIAVDVELRTKKMQIPFKDR